MKRLLYAAAGYDVQDSFRIKLQQPKSATQLVLHSITKAGYIINT